MSQAIRSMSLNRSTSLTLPELARRINPMVRGSMNYYGAFYPEPLKRFLIRIDLRLGGWARNKYKQLRGHKRRAWAWLKRCRESIPIRTLGFLFRRTADKRSRMNREIHVRIYESLRGQFPRATRRPSPFDEGQWRAEAVGE
ncbi:hypothetical protein J8I82_37490 [Cupriavidus sp. LEh25]|nr:hypothetical protein [Cupriavidus sp. LEh25]